MDCTALMRPKQARTVQYTVTHNSGATVHTTVVLQCRAYNAYLLCVFQTGRSRGFGFVYFEDSEDAADVSVHVYTVYTLQ